MNVVPVWGRMSGEGWPASETLSVDLRNQEPGEGMLSVEDSIGGHSLKLGVQRR